ncbi:LlaMI family restriction endonuclease [Aliarcobacter cryaerophilus]|uniref:LlaMI family restriction endonuclease n=1 Tax=Aliarcobacter cryaerophilus TaxID=28198 RepID=UPI00112F16B5|nr:LlaMI family restriction endonuclease [Aliarcobacter cryaerophilus]
MENKEKIVKLFIDNVKGNIADTSSSNQNHDGKTGHWLEKKMGITHNSDNKPDLFGYEMKNETTSGKISFGDWSADEYIFLHGRGKNKINSINENYQLTRKQFFEIFGKPNIEKNNRLSWSGTPCPKYYLEVTTFGQELKIDDDDNIIIVYHYSKDQRVNKNTIVPFELQNDNITIALWKKDILKRKLEDKFNQNGWFTVSTNRNGAYENIHFGEPMNYDSWIKLFKERQVFFDSGMYDGNMRPYSQWRATTGIWHSLITESF